MKTPLAYPCFHMATDAECRRDPGYSACAAEAGDPCRWAHRDDGVSNPAFHSERLEAAAYAEPHSGQVNDEAFEQAVLDTGLV